MMDVTTIKVGARLKLQEGVVAEVIENMDDGQWLQVRCLESPARPDEVGTVELCHAQDIVKVLSE
ncbi:hypothetical protein [Bradyrhizobium jicamae]|nr:hypothetical protein [Bradyrhizobium jicamae]